MGDNEQGAAPPPPAQLQLVGAPAAGGGSKAPQFGVERGGRGQSGEFRKANITRTQAGIDEGFASDDVAGPGIDPPEKVTFGHFRGSSPSRLSTREKWQGLLPSLLGLREGLERIRVRVQDPPDPNDPPGTPPTYHFEQQIALPLAARHAVAKLERFTTDLNMMYFRESSRRGDALGAGQVSVGMSRDELSSAFAELISSGQISESDFEGIQAKFDKLHQDIDEGLGGNLQPGAVGRSIGIGVLLGGTIGTGLLWAGLHIAAFLGAPLIGTVLATVAAPIGLPILGIALGIFITRRIARGMAAGEETRRATQFHAAHPDLLGSAPQVDATPLTAHEIAALELQQAREIQGLGEAAAHMPAASHNIRQLVHETHNHISDGKGQVRYVDDPPQPRNGNDAPRQGAHGGPAGPAAAAAPGSVTNNVYANGTANASAHARNRNTRRPPGGAPPGRPA